MFGKSLLFALLASICVLLKADVVLECKNNGHPLHPYPGDCTRFFECTPQGIEVHVCPDGLHFNRGYLVCDYPQSAGCTQEGAEVTIITDLETTALPELTTAEPGPETTPSEEVNTTPGGETEEIDCPIDADDSLRPHPTNCNQFYQCFWGEALIYTCEEGLHFNPAAQVCDYPENVGCVGGTVPPNVPTTQAPEIDTDTTPESQPNTTPGGETEQFNCPIDADLSFRPHPTNCNQFYQCYAGESHIFTCQAGLHFNPAEQVCDYPENVGCVGGTVPPNVSTTQAPEIDTDTTPESQPNTTPGGETEQFDCPIDADLSFRPHPTNCNQFYQCYAGESHIFTCQEGLYFNPAEQVCDYPENVGCAGGTAPHVTSPSAPAAPTTGGGASDPEPFECRSDSDQLYHSVPTNCNQFYQCYDGHAYTFNCQVGLQFHYEAQACDYPENVGCVNA